MSDGHPLNHGGRNALHEAPQPTGREATAQQLELAGAYDHLYEGDEVEAKDAADDKPEVEAKPKRKPRAKHEKSDEKSDEKDDVEEDDTE